MIAHNVMTRVRPREVRGRLLGVVGRLREHPAARRLRRPTVSVIVPIYNVERYLGECLDSVLDQSFADFEVVVVDDGSPDGSRAIAERYAAADRRVRVVARENGGLGAARNTGIRHARGEFLTFLDSDDVLPPSALGAMVASALESGSDIVVGSLRRFDAHGAWAPQWVPDVHVVRRRRVQLHEFLPLIRNLYTVDKLYRRRFWMEQGLWFREGVAYEDQPLVTQLLARARGIDVIPDDVYHYRRRDDRSSISQETASLTDLRQRVEAWRLSREVLRGEAAPEIYHGWLQTLFNAHFHWYLSSAGTVDDTYWAELRAVVVDLTADAPEELWHETSPEKRVLIELARRDRRADAQEFVRQGGLRLDQWRSEVRADGILVQLPFFDDPELDPDLFLLRPGQVRAAHSVETARWLEGDDVPPGTCALSGWAYLRKVDLAEHENEVSLVLRGLDSGEEHVFPAEGAREPAFPPPVEDSWCDYSPGRFRAALPVGQVLTAGHCDREWEVLVRVRAAGLTVTEPVSNLLRSGSAGVIPAATLPDGDRLVAVWRRGETLRFRRSPLAVQVSDVRLDGRQLSGTLTGPAAAHLVSVEVAADDTRARARLADDTGAGKTFRVTLPPARRVTVESPAEWQAVALDGDRAPVPLTLVDDGRPVARSAEGALTVYRRRNGDLAVTEWRLGAVADELTVADDGVLRLSGTVFGPGATTVSLATRNKKARAAGPEAPVENDRFVAELPLEHEVYRFGTHPLPSGEHDVVLLARVEGRAVEVPLRLSPSIHGDLPVPVDTRFHQGRLVRGPAGGVRISLVRPMGDARGRYRQQRLQAAAPGPGRLTRGVLMRAYFGEHATDNGVAVQRELRRRGSDLPVYWAVQDHSVPVPEGGIPVVVNSREWYQLLSSVEYYLDNMYQPEYHRKPDGQVIVQTFHGYPFKVMGHTLWRNMQLSRARIDAYDARAAEWDFLVSPARYATPLLCREFNYRGEVLEIGYPRNDVLQSPEADELRRVTRWSLGLADGQTAVLYAPTFRDYLAKGESKAAMADFFDYEEATRALGDEVVILVRGHAFNARSRQRVGSGRGVVDVTDYPEVSDLYLAADAAVVDYSSLRFDFGVTGKPMVFLCPDLQRYQDTRGWLFDFEPTAPGPIVATTAEVVAALQDLDGVRRDHREPYDAFRSQYLDLEDGHAAQRLVDAVFVPRGDA